MVKGMPGNFDYDALHTLAVEYGPSPEDVQNAIDQELRHLMFDRAIVERKAYEMIIEKIDAELASTRRYMVDRAQAALIAIREESK